MKHRKGYRLITVNSKVWQWGMGRTCVTAVCEDGTRLRDKLTDVLGLPWNIIEDNQNDRCLHVTPSDIAGWIEKST